MGRVAEAARFGRSPPGRLFARQPAGSRIRPPGHVSHPPRRVGRQPARLTGSTLQKRHPMLTWSRFQTSFGNGAVVLRNGRVRRVLLPVQGEAIEARIARISPDAEPAPPGHPAAREAARTLEQAFEGGALPAGFLRRIDWPDATPFQLAVLKACARIPRGEVKSYGELAEAAGFPGRSRAVGTVMAKNPLPILVPCHRVVRSGGAIGNYGGGAAMKRWLLEREGAIEA